MDLDTAHLRALTVLADELHFGRAAARLGLSQQALSKRIQRLETDLGGLLVDRTDRRAVRLTEAGRRVLPVAYEVLAAVDRLPLRDTAPDRIRIDIMDEHLAPADWVRRAARGLPVDVVHRSSDATADELVRTGRAHLAFGRAGAIPFPWPPGIRRRLVLLEPLSVLVPRDHPWAALDQLRLADLAGRTLWFPMSDAPYEWRSYVAEFAAHSGATVDTTGSTFGYRQWITDVTEGSAPPSLIGEAMSLPAGTPVHTVPITDPTPVFPWWALWREEYPAAMVADLLAAMGFPVEAPLPGPDAWLPAGDATLLAQPGSR